MEAFASKNPKDLFIVGHMDSLDFPPSFPGSRGGPRRMMSDFNPTPYRETAPPLRSGYNQRPLSVSRDNLLFLTAVQPYPQKRTGVIPFAVLLTYRRWLLWRTFLGAARLTPDTSGFFLIILFSPLCCFQLAAIIMSGSRVTLPFEALATRRLVLSIGGPTLIAFC